MKTLLEALEKNIEAEIEVQHGIQVLLDQQLDILLRGKTERLTAVLAAAEDGVNESRALEIERTILIGRIAEKVGIPSKELTLEKLEAKVGTAAATLVDKGAVLKELLIRIRESNRRVGLLLRHSVLFIEDLVRALTGASAPPATYGRTGARESRGPATIVAEA